MITTKENQYPNKSLITLAHPFSVCRFKNTLNENGMTNALSEVLYEDTSIVAKTSQYTNYFSGSIEQYLPWTAAISIIGKAIWKAALKTPLQQKIKSLKKNIRILKTIQNNTQKNCLKKIEALRKEIQIKKEEAFHGLLALSQLGSLIFPHPGSNIWNSTNQLAGRIFSLRSFLPSRNSSIKNQLATTPLKIALCGIGALGLTISILKQTNLIQAEHNFFRAAIGASFIGMTIEGIVTVQNYIYTRLK